jgi:hypothetical protein
VQNAHQSVISPESIEPDVPTLSRNAQQDSVPSNAPHNPTVRFFKQATRMSFVKEIYVHRWIHLNGL